MNLGRRAFRFASGAAIFAFFLAGHRIGPRYFVSHFLMFERARASGKKGSLFRDGRVGRNYGFGERASFFIPHFRGWLGSGPRHKNIFRGT